MRYYHYILIFLFLAVIARAAYIVYRIKKQLQEKGIIKEGFESLENCLEQGYPTRFCKRVPLEACVTNCQ
jgi:hypothetical protein